MSSDGRHRILALFAVAAVHGVAAWVLFRDVLPGEPARPASPLLRVRWIERPRPLPVAAVPERPATGPSATPRSAGPTRRPAPTAMAVAAEDRPLPAAPAPAAPVDYVAQGAEWARGNAATPTFVPALTDSRTPALPGGSGRERIRMSDPLTPAKVVGFIGRLFGDRGDPCPSKRDEVQRHLVDTSEQGRRRLEWELREYREHCRP